MSTMVFPLFLIIQMKGSIYLLENCRLLKHHLKPKIGMNPYVDKHTGIIHISQPWHALNSMANGMKQTSIVERVASGILN